MLKFFKNALSIGLCGFSLQLLAVENPPKQDLDMQLVGAIRQGSGGKTSQSIALIRPRPGAPSVAVVTGAALPFAGHWQLVQVDSGRILLQHIDGTTKRLGVEGDIPERVVKVVRSDVEPSSDAEPITRSKSEDRPASIIQAGKEDDSSDEPSDELGLGELEWKESVTLEDLEKALSDAQ